MTLQPKRLRIEAVGFSGAQAEVRIEAARVLREQRIRRVTLVPSSDAPCAGSRSELQYELVGSARANVLMPSTELVVKIPGREWERVDDGSARIDLELESAADGSSCVGVPLFSEDPREQWELDQKWAVFHRYHYERFPGGEGADYRGEISLGGGRWVGGWLVAATIGVGFAQCREDTCSLVPVGDVREEKMRAQQFAGPLFGLEANSWPLQAGLLTGGLGVRYWARMATLPTLTGDKITWLHGPELVPHLGLSDLKWQAPGVPGGPRLSAIDIEFPVGLALSGEGHAFASFGLGLTLQTCAPWW